jgi:hypothetical protein
MEEMERRAQVVGDPNNQDAQAKAVEAGLIRLDSEASPPVVSWLYSRWDPANKAEVTDELLTPLTHEALLRRFASIRKRISGETLLRCHTTRPLTVGMQGETVVLLVELATNNPDSQAMHEAFQDLCQLAMWRLICGRLRRDRIQRTPLAVQLQTWIQQAPGGTTSNQSQTPWRSD